MPQQSSKLETECYCHVSISYHYIQIKLVFVATCTDQYRKIPCYVLQCWLSSLVWYNQVSSLASVTNNFSPVVINAYYESLDGIDIHLGNTVFLLSYRNTSGSLGEWEMLWEHKLQTSVSTAFFSSPKLSQVLQSTTP